jgi:hypothetical protein
VIIRAAGLYRTLPISDAMRRAVGAGVHGGPPPRGQLLHRLGELRSPPARRPRDRCGAR